jgi:hypothetical protein
MPEIYQEPHAVMNPSYSEWNQPELQRQMFNAQNALDWDKMMGDYNTRQRQSDIEQQRAETEKLLGQQKLTNEMSLAGMHGQNQIDLAKIKTDADKHLYDKNLVTQMIAGGMSAGTPFNDIEDNVLRAKDLANAGRPGAAPGVAPPPQTDLKIYGTRGGTSAPIVQSYPGAAAPPPSVGPPAPAVATAPETPALETPAQRKARAVMEEASKRVVLPETAAAKKNPNDPTEVPNQQLSAQQFIDRYRQQQQNLKMQGVGPEQQNALLKQIVQDASKKYIDFNRPAIEAIMQNKMQYYGVPQVGDVQYKTPWYDVGNHLKRVLGGGMGPSASGSIHSLFNNEGFNRDAQAELQMLSQIRDMLPQ